MSTLYVFDLDGVITDPGTSLVNESAVDLISGLMQSGKFVAVNTGRSYEWVEQHLLQRLREIPHLDYGRFAISCEKGGSLITWQDGIETETAGSVALPPEMLQQVHSGYIKVANDYSTMFWDATKRTMASIEKYPKADLNEFHQEQTRFGAYMQDVLAGQDVTIDLSNISTDIESTEAGKSAGSAQLLQWCRHYDDAPQRFVSIGDSLSDYGMAHYFAIQRLDSTFVYVGKPTDEFKHDPRVTFVTTEQHFAHGAIEYFKSGQK